MKNLITILMFLATIGTLNAQSNKTSRGLELLKDGKFREAVEVFTGVLRNDPNDSEALLSRARAKYEAGAYKGAVNDCFSYMEKNGIDAPVAGLMGKTEYAMENYKKALSYLKVAITFEPSGEEYLLDRGQVFYDLGLDDDACQDWYNAAVNGSIEGKRLSARYCKSFKVDRPSHNKPHKNEDEDVTDVEDIEEDEPVTRPNRPSYEDDNHEDSNQNDTADNSEMKPDVPLDNNSSDEVDDTDSDILVEDHSYEDDYPIDRRTNEIYIDEDLTIKIADGIGSREVKELPDMIILSDYNGEVVVDICVNRIGRVISSSLNENRSSIKTKSLVSLALRKSEEFWFARTDRAEQCGTITFVIRAGNE